MHLYSQMHAAIAENLHAIRRSATEPKPMVLFLSKQRITAMMQSAIP